MLYSSGIHADTLGIESLQLLRQQIRDEERKKQQEKMPDVQLDGLEALHATGRLPEKESPCFVINHFALKSTGAAAFPIEHAPIERSFIEHSPGEDFPIEDFQWALAAINPVDDPASGKCLGTTGVNLLIKRVQNAIIARGYVTTRVLAEPQQLATGTLLLSVIPGVVNNIYFANEADDRANRWNVLPVQTEALLNLRDIEQGLENFKRLPSVEADIKIAPAAGANAQPGDSDVLINWQQNFPLRLTAAVDDAGNQAIGQYQGNVALAYDHLLQLNDILDLTINQNLSMGEIEPSRSHGYNVHYSLPYHYWLLTLSAGENDYVQTVAGLVTSVVYRGNSHTADIKLLRRVYRDPARKSSVSLRGWARRSNNFIDDLEVEGQRRRMAGWEAAVNHREFIGRSTLDATLTYKRGTGAWDALPAAEEQFGEGNAHPKIIIADVQYATVFNLAGVSINYTGVARAQWYRTSLVPQDRFAIGGRYTVRGFDGENVLAAHGGGLVRNDFGYSLDNSLGAGHELYVGLDAGRVSGGPNPLPGNTLIGEVLGVRGGYKQFSYDVFIGRPVSKPAGFKTAKQAAGFSMQYVF